MCAQGKAVTYFMADASKIQKEPVKKYIAKMDGNQQGTNLINFQSTGISRRDRPFQTGHLSN